MMLDRLVQRRMILDSTLRQLSEGEKKKTTELFKLPYQTVLIKKKPCHFVLKVHYVS